MKTAAFTSWAAILLLWAAAPSAGAACLANPDNAMQHLQTLVAENPALALKQVQSRLDVLGREPSADRNARLASLYAVQAEAFGMLELTAESRNSAAAGLKLATGEHDPVHLALLSIDAENVYDSAGITAAMATVEAARAAQPAGSAADTCLLMTRGLLEHRQDRDDLAVVSLTRAYAASAAPSMAQPHAWSAALLSVVMRGMGDFTQALALNQEQIDWDTSHGATLDLSVARFMRGQILKLMGSYDAAIGEFAEARKLSVSLGDEQGVAYADLRSCEAHIELGAFTLAEQECDAALRTFAASPSADSLKETRTLQARIDLEQGMPARALATLNGVLDRGGSDMPPMHVASVYEWRARANADMHKYREAYADLQEYLKRYAAANDAERRREGGILRARFDTDREVERNASLKRELALSEERSKRQLEQLKLNAIVGFASVCVIALLIYFLATTLRYRQRLVKLASQDALTGLPNRRRIAQLATAALETAKNTNRPLAIAIIDMDHFKFINDRCGHAAGDHVLKEFARAGGEALRPDDMLGRWGGEEFLLVMPEATVKVAAATLERLRTLVFGIRLPAAGTGLRVSLSAGIAEYESNVRSLDELVARADGALYAAKNDGRDLVRVADATLVTGSHAVRRVLRQ